MNKKCLIKKIAYLTMCICILVSLSYVGIVSFNSWNDHNIEKSDLVTIANNKAVICLVDDDGSQNFISLLQPILEKHDKLCSIAVITDTVGSTNHMNWDTIINLSNKGYDICSHSDSHSEDVWVNYDKKLWENTKNTKQEISKSIKNSQDALNNKGVDTSIIVYPYGTHTYKYRMTANKYFHYGVTTQDGYMPSGSSQNRMALNRTFINNNNDIKYYYTLIDNTIKNNGFLILGIHSSMPEEWDAIFVDKILAYIDKSDADWTTLDNAINSKIIEKDNTQ